MADLTDAQRKRQESRKRRRGSDDGPAAENDAGEHQPLETVVNAAKVASVAAAVGAAAAAARELASRRADEDEEPEQSRGEPDSEEEPEAKASEEPDREEEELEPEQGEPQQRQQQWQGEGEEEMEQEPVEGAAFGDARTVARRAREQLEALLGKPVESVSSLERTHDGWVVALEVVELSRIPESTDVLASYELELDEDLNFRRYQQARRYTRSQADRGEE